MFCAELGSRGYGTNTKDSDSDVKGFFIHKKSNYLTVRDEIDQL